MAGVVVAARGRLRPERRARPFVIVALILIAALRRRRPLRARAGSARTRACHRLAASRTGGASHRRCEAIAAPRAESTLDPAVTATVTAALEALEAVPLGLPPGLELEWLGVAGYRLTYEDVSILVDPYVSRVPLRNVLLRRRALPDAEPDRPLHPRAGDVAGILIGHTHWDHAVDAPALARRFDAPAYGSESLAHLMRLHGLDARRRRAAAPYELGPFVGQLHAEPALEAAVRAQGAVRRAADLRGRARAQRRARTSAARCTGSGSRSRGSRSITRAAPTSTTRSAIEPVDVFLAGVTGRQVTPRYWERILPRLDPRVLVPTHYDDFFAPLGKPLKLVRRVGIAAAPRRGPRGQRRGDDRRRAAGTRWARVSRSRSLMSPTRVAASARRSHRIGSAVSGTSAPSSVNTQASASRRTAP